MVALGFVALGATSCGTSLRLATSGAAAAYVDDLYGVHDIAALKEAERLLAEREAAARAENEKRIAAMIAAANAEADIDAILGDVDVVASPAGTVVASGGGASSYNNLYVDDYRSAYARRLQGFSSLSYRMPSSYWDYRYGDAYFLTLAYDPAFYTVMVMGDQVWVEPRYITNMFGSWNNPYYYGYRYGYNPYYYGYSYGYWDYWGWNSPYWGCDPFYHYHYHYHHWYGPHYGHHHHPSYHPDHRPGGPGGPGGNGHHKPNVTHRPSYGTTAGGSTSRPSYREQLGGGGVRSTSRGGTQIASGTRDGSTTSRGGAIVGSSARPEISTSRPAGGGNLTRIENTTTKGTMTTITTPKKGELSGTLSGTTIDKSRPTRSSGVSGSSNSSSRSSRSATSVRSSSSSSSRSSAVKSSSSSSRSSSSRSSSSVSSSRSSSSSRGSFSSGGGSSSRSSGGSSSSRSRR